MSERIAGFAVHPVALPFRRAYLTATGRIERREMAVVEIRGESGARGWGDAVPMSLRGGPGLARLVADLRAAEALLTETAIEDGSPRDAVASITALPAALRRGGAAAGAAAAVEVALFDLAGKLTGMAVHELLGSVEARPVECNGTVGADPPHDAAAGARALAEAGFRVIKVKVGDGASVADDIARMLAVRAAVGPDVGLRIDANRAYTPAQAIELLGEPGLDLELAEQPCESLPELRTVREGSSVPVVADESVNDVAQARAAIGADACDAVTVKLAKVGGPSAALEIAATGPTYLSSALDGVIGIAAAIHAAQALGAPRAARSRAFPTGLAHGLATSALFSDNVADAGGFTGPSIAAPDGPGLGVEVDAAALRRLRIEG